ncbi:MAG: hypothetical protein FWG65_03785 [Turicibacter sp.]|nr:hypothetical protein [Turicibacter sp.]
MLGYIIVFAIILFLIPLLGMLFEHYTYIKQKYKRLKCQNCEYRRNYFNNSKFGTYHWDRQRRTFVKKEGE